MERTLCMGRLRSHMSSISMAAANIDEVDSADVISDAKVGYRSGSVYIASCVVEVVTNLQFDSKLLTFIL